MKRYTVGYYDGWHSDLEKGIHDVYLIAEVREKVLPVLQEAYRQLEAEALPVDYIGNLITELEAGRDNDS